MGDVQSIERAFRLLTTVADVPGTISELSRRSDLPNSTVARILGTLQNLEMVTRLENGVFVLGANLIRLCANSGPSAEISALDLGRVAALAGRIGEIVGLSVREGRFVHYVREIDSGHEVQVRDWTGERVPLHVVSSGLVFLANAGAEYTQEYLTGELERFTEGTLADPDAVRRRLDKIREDGFIWTDEEFHPGISSVAAPIFNARGEVVAALHSHGPTYRFPAEGQRTKVARIVERAASALSHSIGWTGPSIDPAKTRRATSARVDNSRG